MMNNYDLLPVERKRPAIVYHQTGLQSIHLDGKAMTVYVVGPKCCLYYDKDTIHDLPLIPLEPSVREEGSRDFRVPKLQDIHSVNLNEELHRKQEEYLKSAVAYHGTNAGVLPSTSHFRSTLKTKGHNLGVMHLAGKKQSHTILIDGKN